ncbi:MAG: hypothetical protein Sv326_1084 [Candidatus Fermentimicrarchaeum limneticum]|jgi:hypothetical protein|uniref:Uncharacterized protein n=1 Tax=Fermentimicrarchaeum limneticum TaxID=2795018 RepID=A0A7D6BCP0_FERL1|nr:MAG: hypothetical protein Sv326_1084 [Candidatus Fermentimicrarchaeum limneticum]
MSSDEKQRIIEMWDGHIEKHDIRLKFLSSNATQEEQFDADFKENVLQSKKLTNEEKQEVLRYAEL